MIYYVKGDLFQSPAQALVNTVNTEGVMGKGIALQFKIIFPEMFRQYRDICEQGKFKTGQLWLFKTSHKWILNFPTKTVWRQPSRVEYIRAGLENFVANFSALGIHSIAFPRLGCGNGELSWKTVVQPMMKKYLSPLPVDCFIYPHKPSPEAPEHRTAKEIKKWLQSEPEALPFSAVWEDLNELLQKKHSFQTLSKGTKFSATIVKEPAGIRIKDRGAYISHGTLLTFWKQIRSYGLTARPLVPGGLEKTISYIAPIFAELPYIKVVRMSETYKGLESNPAFGLQYLAPNQTGVGDLDLFLNQVTRKE